MEDDGTVFIRIVHDGTTGVGVNKHIKVLDACLYPLAPDIKATLRRQTSRRTDHGGLVVDVSGAHRTVLVREEYWPLQVCQMHGGGDSFTNTVGTLGISSAAYWWGRLAAAVHRAGLSVVSALWRLWALLFADGWNLVAEAARRERALFGFLWWFVALRVPLSWHKVQGGASYTWVGYETCLRY